MLRILLPLTAVILCFAASLQAQELVRPNVVLIVCDDLNDYVHGYGGHPQAQTPHVAAFAESAVAFRHAYCTSPVCAPSRSSFLTGIQPHRSGNFGFHKWYKNPVLAHSKTVMQHFADNGYRTLGGGKLMHHFHHPEWQEFPHRADYGPMIHDGSERCAHPAVPQPFNAIGPVDGSFGPLGDLSPHGERYQWIYGTWKELTPFRYASAEDRDPTPDERVAAWAAKRLRSLAADTKRGKPFFMGVGFIRPHTPLHAPQEYFDRFPIDAIQLPPLPAGDADDTHFRDVIDADHKGLRYFRALRESYPGDEEGLRRFLQAYLACIAAVDDCIGQVIAAVDASPLRENTIVIITSDHGWTMGEKDYCFKNAPWESSARVPMLIRAPGVGQAGAVCSTPVSLIDLYPTLNDLCGLTGDTRKNDQGRPLDGHSMRPLLQDPEAGTWSGPDGALTMVYARGTEMVSDQQHYSIRTRRWRYIRYNNGAEELYDHDSDPNEFHNLADQASHTADRQRLAALLDAQLGEQ